LYLSILTDADVEKMAGRAKQCLVSNLLETEQADLTPEKESLIKWAAASVYAGKYFTHLI